MLHHFFFLAMSKWGKGDARRPMREVPRRLQVSCASVDFIK